MMNSTIMKRVTLIEEFSDEDDSFEGDDSYDEYEDEF